MTRSGVSGARSPAGPGAAFGPVQNPSGPNSTVCRAAADYDAPGRGAVVVRAVVCGAAQRADVLALTNSLH